jgi:beta-lactamase class A
LTRKQNFFYVVFMPFSKKYFIISLILSFLFFFTPPFPAFSQGDPGPAKKKSVKHKKDKSKKKPKKAAKKKKKKKGASVSAQKPEKPPVRVAPVVEEKERPVEMTPRPPILPAEGLPLQALVEQEIVHLKSTRSLLPADEISIQIYDLEGKRLLADLNGNTVRNSASLIKVFVMLAVYDQIARQELQETPELDRHLYRMIAISDNGATNALIHRLGHGDATQGIITVNALLQRYGFAGTRLRELIPEGGKTYANQTTVADTTYFFRLLYEQKLISPQYSQKMNDILLKNIHDRIRTTQIKKDGIAVADKTGYVRGLNGDCGIVYQGGNHRGCDYILSVIIENRNKPAEGSWGKKKSSVIRYLSDRIYQSLKNGYSKSGPMPRQG